MWTPQWWMGMVLWDTCLQCFGFYRKGSIWKGLLSMPLAQWCNMWCSTSKGWTLQVNGEVNFEFSFDALKHFLSFRMSPHILKLIKAFLSLQLKTNGKFPFFFHYQFLNVFIYIQENTQVQQSTPPFFFFFFFFFFVLHHIFLDQAESNIFQYHNSIFMFTCSNRLWL